MSDEERVKLITQIANNFGISCDDANYIIKSFENFGKEQVMLNIEDDVNVLGVFCLAGRIEIISPEEFEEVKIAIRNILSEREQDKERIKELEEENMQKDLEKIGIEENIKADMKEIIEKYYTANEECIPKQKVIDIVKQIQEEYNKVQEQFDCIWNKKSKDNYDRYKLQELSAMQQELGFILGKFEKLLEEGE